MTNLIGQVALVTGASRGVGKGVALGLCEAGATVYVTGRTRRAEDSVGGLGGTVFDTAREAEALGGKCIPLICDHTDDEAVQQVFQTIREQSGRLDVLVNNVWGGYEYFVDGTEFWNEKGFWMAPVSRWDKMFQSGVRAHYVASALAAPVMIAQGSGLIVNISFFAAQRNDKGVIYGTAKGADDHMAACMAHELRPFGVSAVSLYPGLVRTEGVLRAAEFFDMSNSESPQFIGRAVAALAADPNVIERSGSVQIAARVALDYGFTDIDGRQPRPLTVEET